MGYRDEVGVILENIDSPIRKIDIDHINNPNTPISVGLIEFGAPISIAAGEKIAQLVLCEVPKVCWTEVEQVTAFGEDRGGGYGSTGLV